MIEWTNFSRQMDDFIIMLLAECKLIFIIFNVEFWNYYFYLYVGINHICITCILLNIFFITLVY